MFSDAAHRIPAIWRRRHALARVVGGLIVAWSLLVGSPGAAQEERPVPGGALQIVGPDGQPLGACPLKHTDVQAEIVGMVARVQVRQTFHNPRTDKIDAVYVFPLPQDAAVDDMAMLVGDRRIVGQIKPRDDARAIYEQARAAGHVASLLDQERPNIFTQSVANIEPGAQVVIDISYVETVPYTDGEFEFVVPTVVGPRYMPGVPVGHAGTGTVPDTTGVPDASRISPPVTRPGTRAGHDLSLTVRLDTGRELGDVQSVLHEVDIQRTGPGRASVTLKQLADLPNRDFILRYRTAGDAIGDMFLAESDRRGTFFTLVLEPPRRVVAEQVRPKELVFVIDRSGSMSGFPIEKAKETMRLAIERMHPHDTFNLMSFAGGTGRCFDKPVPNTPANRAAALQYLDDLQGAGGTEMMPAILEALGGPIDPRRLRVVCFMTDGYIGDDMAIIDAVRRNAGTARVFAFGIGNAVNRFLLDRMALVGRGQVEYVTLESAGDAAATRFQERVDAPVFTDISIDWGTLPVTDVSPLPLRDLFSVQPLVVYGRLTGPADGTVTVRGTAAGGPFVRTLRVAGSPTATRQVLSRRCGPARRVEQLMLQDYGAAAVRRPAGRVAHAGDRVGPGVSLDDAVYELRRRRGDARDRARRVAHGGGARRAPVGGALRGHLRCRGKMSALRAAGGAAKYQMAVNAAVPAAPSEHDLGFFGPNERKEGVARARSVEPEMKLALALRDLADTVGRDGKEGTLTTASVHVVGYRVDVVVYLTDVTPTAIEALKRLGFRPRTENAAARVVIGSIDVRRLKELAQLGAVVRVTPVAV